MSGTYKDIGVSSEGHVGVVEIQRPPHNFFDNSLINQIADAFEAFDKDGNIRAYVLCAQGKSFCAGADFANRPQTGAAESGKHLYKEATRLFRAKKPSVGAIQGPAIGGAGLRPVGEIGAGAERLALGAQHVSPDVAVAVERLEGVGDLVDQRIVEEIVRRPLDFDDADMTFAADADILVGGAHTFPPRANG